MSDNRGKYRGAQDKIFHHRPLSGSDFDGGRHNKKRELDHDEKHQSPITGSVSTGVNDASRFAKRSKVFNTKNKTALTCLYEICTKRGFGEPIFKEIFARQNVVAVAVIIDGNSYGCGSCVNYLSACELASISTLQVWLPDFTPSERCIKAIKETIDNAMMMLNIQANQSEDDEEFVPKDNVNDKNASILLHEFTTAICPEISSKPIIEVTGCSGGKFRATADISLDSKEFNGRGEGYSKTSAKRDACFALLREIYPNCHTLEDIELAMEAQRNERKKYKRMISSPVIKSVVPPLKFSYPCMSTGRKDSVEAPMVTIPWRQCKPIVPRKVETIQRAVSSKSQDNARIGWHVDNHDDRMLEDVKSVKSNNYSNDSDDKHTDESVSTSDDDGSDQEVDDKEKDNNDDTTEVMKIQSDGMLSGSEVTSCKEGPSLQDNLPSPQNVLPSNSNDNGRNTVGLSLSAERVEIISPTTAIQSVIADHELSETTSLITKNKSNYSLNTVVVAIQTACKTVAHYRTSLPPKSYLRVAVESDEEALLELFCGAFSATASTRSASVLARESNDTVRQKIRERLGKSVWGNPPCLWLCVAEVSTDDENGRHIAGVAIYSLGESAKGDSCLTLETIRLHLDYRQIGFEDVFVCNAAAVALCLGVQTCRWMDPLKPSITDSCGDKDGLERVFCSETRSYERYADIDREELLSMMSYVVKEITVDNGVKSSWGKAFDHAKQTEAEGAKDFEDVPDGTWGNEEMTTEDAAENARNSSGFIQSKRLSDFYQKL